MAGLATAIGLGGKLPSEFSGDAEIIKQAGEGLSGSIRAAGAGVNAGMATIQAKQKEKEQYLTPFSTNINALQRDREQYVALASDFDKELRKAADSGASASQLRDMKIRMLDILADAKQRYEGDMEAYNMAYEIAQKHPEKDISEFNRFISQGGYDETEVYQEGNVGAGPVAEKTGSPYEQGQEPGKMVAKRVGVPYMEMTLEQKKKAAPGGLMAELNKKVKDASGTFNKASQSTFDQPDLGFLVKRTWNKVNGVGQYDYEVNPEEVAQSLNTFMAQRGRTDDLEVKKYWNTLTNVFEKKGKDIGLAGQELKDFVDGGVEATARRDFYTNLESARMKRMQEDKYTVDKEGKGLNIQFNDGGGVSAGVVSFEKVSGKSTVRQAALNEQKKVIQGKIDQLKARMASGELAAEGGQKAIRDYEKIIGIYDNYPDAVKSYLFSAQKNITDSPLHLSDGENMVLMKPIGINKERGGWKVVGIAEEKRKNKAGETVTESVPKMLPLNEENIKLLNQNKIGFKEAFGAILGMQKDEKPAAKEKPNTAAPKKYKVGQILNGYRFKGGDPTQQSNWEKI